MNLRQNTKIKGLYVYEGLNFNDSRGSLIKPVSFDLQGIKFDVKETWFTCSKKNVIRGMHMQIDPYPINKLVSVIQGKVIDVVLDCRKESSTFGMFEHFLISAAENKLIKIPIGCAHGYKVLEDNTITMYMSDNLHHGLSDVGYHYNSFGYNWDIAQPIISERDNNLPDFI